MDGYRRLFFKRLRRIEINVQTGAEEIPRFTNLKATLETLFNNISVTWSNTPLQREDKAPTALEKVRWSLIRTHLQTVIKKMRKLQKISDRQCCHTTNPFQPIEMIYEKFNDLWLNHLLPANAHIANDDKNWINLWIAFAYLRESIFDLIEKTEFEEIDDDIM